MHKVNRKKKSAEELAQKVLYFAYGSNMFQERLEKRVGRVTCLGAHKLKGYELTFDTGSDYECFANVKRSKGSCEGVIYELTYNQLLQLDWHEGLYVRIKEEYNGRKLHLYISDSFRDEKRIPEITSEYRDALVRGCLAHNLKQSLKIINKVGTVRYRPVNIHMRFWEEYYD